MKTRYAPIIHGAFFDRPDEQDTVDAARAVAEALGRQGFATDVVQLDLDFTPLIQIAKKQPHVVFNLVDSIHGDGSLFPLAPSVLEDFGVAHTGASARTCEMLGDKLRAKRALIEHDLPTPVWWSALAAPPAEATVIVKSATEHASIGLDVGSIVSGAQAAAEIKRREKRYGGFFFAEAFVDGREFNVAVLENDGQPDVLPISEIVFDRLPPGTPRIVDYEAKWEPESDAYQSMPRRFGLEQAEPALAAELTRLAIACWGAFEMNGYARVDFRVGADGRPTILEVNANPCLAPDAGFAAAAQEAGLGYDVMIRRIAEEGARTGAH